jgi:hypothetical protein
MSEVRKPYVGAQVHITQHGSPEKPLAVIVHVHGPEHRYAGTVNLAVYNINGTMGALIGSPEDPTGTKVNCWYWADEAGNPTGY